MAWDQAVALAALVLGLIAVLWATRGPKDDTDYGDDT